MPECISAGRSLTTAVAVNAGERLRAAAGTLAQRAVTAWRWGGDEYFGLLAGKDGKSHQQLTQDEQAMVPS